MRHLTKYLAAPLAFTLAFLLFGAPSAPGGAMVPTVGGEALAFCGGISGEGGSDAPIPPSQPD